MDDLELTHPSRQLHRYGQQSVLSDQVLRKKKGITKLGGVRPDGLGRSIQDKMNPK
jgi:hypothetical protein